MRMLHYDLENYIELILRENKIISYSSYKTIIFYKV